MTAITKYDLNIVRGNSRPFLFRLLDVNSDPVDLSDSEIVLGIKWKDGNLQFSSADVASGLTLDAVNGEVTWTPAIEDTLSLPAGRVAKYEMERRVTGGEERSFLMGYLIAEGGYVDD